MYTFHILNSICKDHTAINSIIVQHSMFYSHQISPVIRYAGIKILRFIRYFQFSCPYIATDIKIHISMYYIVFPINHKQRRNT
jgi:hypothetical protein